jgi:hypothetical protein
MNKINNLAIFNFWKINFKQNKKNLKLKFKDFSKIFKIEFSKRYNIIIKTT